MTENSEIVICRKCRRSIPDVHDRLEHNGKIYCPLCYGKKVKGGPSKGAVFGWILGILLLILVILSWVLYIIISAY
ncbi:MAG: hypothetical protein ACFFCM_15020 [Promethearchaeota archaeon]